MTIALTTAGLLAGCGQTGALYLPTEPDPATVTTGETAPADADSVVSSSTDPGQESGQSTRQNAGDDPADNTPADNPP